MTDAVETMAWRGETPWHGLGTEWKDDKTVAEVLKLAGLNWTVSKQPIYVKQKGAFLKLDGKMALTRDSDESMLSLVGKTWKPVQNQEAFEFFDKFVRAGKAKMETAGSLWGGRYVWGLARLSNIDYDVAKGDKVQNYLLLMSPHVHGKALLAQLTQVRVVCWNTLSMALGSNMKGNRSAFRMPHSTTFNESTRDLAAKALGLAVDEAKLIKDASILLAKKKATTAEVTEYFCEVLDFDPKKPKGKVKQDGTVREPLMLPKFEQALVTAPGQALNSAKGTWWGAFNAVTAVIDHNHGRARDTSLKNAWLGHTAGIKRKAFKLAVERAK